MFRRILRAIQAHLAALAKDFDPDRFTVAQAAEAISLLSAIEKSAAGLRLLLARRVDNESLWGEGGERSAADWLAKQTGQSTRDAARDLECSRRLQELPSAQDAVRNGELSPDQAKAVADGAAADPSCEDELLDTARRSSLSELTRKAKARKAAALGNDEARHAAAYRNRSLTNGTNAEGEQWGRFNGPAADGALVNAYLKPFLEQLFTKARKEGRRERLDALSYDAMMAALAAANGVTDWLDSPSDSQDNDGGGEPSGGGTSPAPPGPPSPPVPAPPPPGAGRANARLIMRVDASALRRGHTVAGELCEIDGLGPGLGERAPQVPARRRHRHRDHQRPGRVQRHQPRPAHHRPPTGGDGPVEHRVQPTRLWRHREAAGRPPHRVEDDQGHRVDQSRLALQPRSPAEDLRRLATRTRHGQAHHAPARPAVVDRDWWRPAR